MTEKLNNFEKFEKKIKLNCTPGFNCGAYEKIHFGSDLPLGNHHLSLTIIKWVTRPETPWWLSSCLRTLSYWFCLVFPLSSKKSSIWSDFALRKSIFVIVPQALFTTSRDLAWISNLGWKNLFALIHLCIQMDQFKLNTVYPQIVASETILF